MRLDPHQFTVHDIRQFPLCLVRNDVVGPGYAEQWQTEVQALLAQGEPFALVYLEPGENEAHEDRKLRSQWLKTHKQAFAKVCVTLISVLADDVRRAQFEAMGSMGEKAFGIRYETAATPEEGEALARQRIEERAASR